MSICPLVFRDDYNFRLKLNSNLTKMNFKEMRLSNHMSKTEISNITGLSMGCISDIESFGMSGNPTFKSIMKYMTALGYEFIFYKTN